MRPYIILDVSILGLAWSSFFLLRKDQQPLLHSAILNALGCYGFFPWESQFFKQKPNDYLCQFSAIATAGSAAIAVVLCYQFLRPPDQLCETVMKYKHTYRGPKSLLNDIIPEGYALRGDDFVRNPKRYAVHGFILSALLYIFRLSSIWLISHAPSDPLSSVLPFALVVFSTSSTMIFAMAVGRAMMRSPKSSDKAKSPQSREGDPR